MASVASDEAKALDMAIGGTPVSLGRRVRAIRKSLGLSLEALSERSGLGVRTLGDIEREVSHVPLRRTVESIATALDLDDDDRAELLSIARRARRTALVIDRAPSVSPHRVTDFSGRFDELRQIKDHLDGHASGRAVIVVSGPAGAGKTALIVEAVARRDSEQMRLFVDLEGFGSSPLSTLEITTRLLEQSGASGQAPTATAEAVERWRSWSATVRAVVVLDNASDADQVLPIVSSTAVGHIMITSRRQMAPMPDGVSLSLGLFSRAESLRLLRKIIPPEMGTDVVLAELAALCGDVPLALRIVGNRVASRPSKWADDLLERMRPAERRLQALVAGDLSVDAALSLSYDELSREEADLFTALGSIDGTTFSADLAAAAAALSPVRAESILLALADLGLVEIVGGSHFRMHDLIRLYVAHKQRGLGDVIVRGQKEAARAWALRTLAQASAWFEPGPRKAPYDDLAFTSSDVAAAWIRAEAQHWWPAYKDAGAKARDSEVLDAAQRLGGFFEYWEWWGAWRALFEISVEAAVRTGDARLEALHYGYLSNAEYAEGNNDEAGFSYALKALDAADRANDDEQRGWANYYASLASWRANSDLKVGMAYASSSVVAFDRAKQNDGIVYARHIKARFHRKLGDASAALEEHESLFAQLLDGEMQMLPELAGLARVACLADMVDDLIELGRYPEASERAAQAVAAARLSPAPMQVTFALTQSAHAHLLNGQLDLARRDVRAADEQLAVYDDARQRQLLEDIRKRIPVAP